MGAVNLCSLIFSFETKGFGKLHSTNPKAVLVGNWVQDDVVECQGRCHREPRLIFSSRWPDAKKAEELRTVKRTAGALLLTYSSANIEYDNRMPHFWHEKSH